MKYMLPELQYGYADLEPFIDEQTMRIHHTKHHQAYIDNLNAALEIHPELQDLPLEQLLKDLTTVPEDIRSKVQNNGGGHFNHTFFWSIMSPNAGGVPTGALAEKINETFGDFSQFQSQFETAAMTRFGSGWAWLVQDAAGKLSIVSTQNQDTPLAAGLTPVIGLDVWEHAYYLKYQNKRAEYVKNWWNTINWKKIESGF